MLINNLNKKITIEEGTQSTNSIGTPTLTYTTFLSSWANVYTPYRNIEFEDGEMNVYHTEFTIRYNSTTKNINNKYRILYDGNYYRILQVIEIGNKEGLKFITKMWEDE